MGLAIELAQTAYENDEVPVGAVIIQRRNSEVLSAFSNQMRATKSPINHAEMLAIQKAMDLIKNDLQNLEKNWQNLLKSSDQKKDVALVYEDLETASSVIRDLFTPDISKITIDSKKLFKKISNYLEDVSPNMASRLEHYKSKKPLFENKGIENEIDKLLRPKVWLKSGSYLII